jgi:DUF3024 family protein
VAGAKVALPDVAVAKVRRFCEAQNRHDLVDKLRNYDVETRRYAVYWADRNDRWRRYEEIEPTEDIEVVLRVIDEDPICVFWG